MRQQRHQTKPATEARFDQVVEMAPDATVVTDSLGRITLVNRQAEALLGYRRTELLGQPVEVLLPARLRTAHQQHRQDYYQEPGVRPMGSGLELFAQHKDGHEIAVEASLSMLDGAGEPGDMTVLVSLRNVTDRKAIERALRQAEDLKDEFIALAVHEHRNPMAALKARVQLLGRRCSAGTAGTSNGNGDRDRREVDAIVQVTNRLLALTNDLLDVTYLQTGKLELHLAPHDLVALVQGVAAQLSMVWQLTGQALRLDLPAEAVRVLCDAPRIEQVLINLLTNAVKYSPEGIAIVLALRTEGALAVVRVTDQGIGIPADQQGSLFGRFVRADNARAREIEGTGLGLFLCRQLVERHGGTIGLASVEGQGTTVWFTLPLVTADTT
jgi:two-component system, OmpR family, phosphate regulon sensor histidine kinase PhoR